MSDSNRPPRGEGEAEASTTARLSTMGRRSRRLRVPVDEVPRLSDQPPPMNIDASGDSTIRERTEASTLKLRTTPPSAAVIEAMPSVIVAKTMQVIVGAPLSDATRDPLRPPSTRAPKVDLDESEDTLIDMPITMGLPQRQEPVREPMPFTVPAPNEVVIRLDEPSSDVPSQAAQPQSIEVSVQTAPEFATLETTPMSRSLPPPEKAPQQGESIPPARLDDEDLAVATEEDLRTAQAIAAPFPPPAPRISMQVAQPPPKPVKVSVPPPPPAPGQSGQMPIDSLPPAVVRLPPRPANPPATTDASAATTTQSAKEAAPDVAPKKKKKAKAWWEEFFNDDFLRTVRAPSSEQVARQCDFIEKSLGLLRGAMILDVGCGLGLHAIELASRGYIVVGLDLSLPMLSRAADEAQDRGIKINFLHSDMKEMGFEGSFDAVICVGTTFGYFDDESNRQVLERFRRSLKPHGLLMLDVVNRDYVIQSQPNLVWFEGDGCVCMEETQFNYITSRLHVKRTMILEDRGQKESEYSIRLYPLHEIGQVMHNMGFRVSQVSGMEATPGVYFGASSPRMIILAERRAEGAPPTGDMAKPPLADEKTTPIAKRTPSSVPPADPDAT